MNKKQTLTIISYLEMAQNQYSRANEWNKANDVTFLMRELEKEIYNGWSNRETWAVHLWLTQDQPIYASVVDLLAQEGRVFEKAERLKEFVEDLYSDNPTVLSDIGSLWRVEWDEIVEAFTEG